MPAETVHREPKIDPERNGAGSLSGAESGIDHSSPPMKSYRLLRRDLTKCGDGVSWQVKNRRKKKGQEGC